MKLDIPRGKYVVAVSGGVDSMVLLDMLAKQVTGDRLRVTDEKKKNSNLQPLTSNLELVVAHFNHGIRPDSAKDEELVCLAAKRYQLPLETGQGKLGPAASEEQAREARYRFLNQVKEKHQADAVITAHHQDDLIETAIINLLRGTGRRGLTAISENPAIIRPLLRLSKEDLLAYAKKNKIEWQEDPTNTDEKYLRNFVRRRIIPELSDSQRLEFLQKIRNLSLTNQIINQEIENLSQKIIKGKTIYRAGFISLPAEVANEVLVHFLRQNDIRGFDKRTIDRLTIAIKTAKAGTKHEVAKGVKFEVTHSSVLLE